MSKKVLIVGGDKSISPLLLQKMREEHGGDIVLYTPEEALEQGLTMNDFDNLPTMTITAPEVFSPSLHGNYPTGRESRRARRKAQRK
jgi:hypothetical protein